jgi:uncharacterized YigZ family protein
MYQYQTITAATNSEFKDRGSKFLAFAYPVADVIMIKKYLQSLKELHPKAVHFCYAYRLGLDKNNYRAVDDGEPSGSAGKPILSQIDSLNLSHVLIVVVRYFGGTLLGVPGLINAYKTATIEALSNALIVTKELTDLYQFDFEYNLTNAVLTSLKKLDAIIIKTDNGLFCSIYAEIPKRLAPEIEAVCKDLYTLEYKKCAID